MRGFWEVKRYYKIIVIVIVILVCIIWRYVYMLDVYLKGGIGMISEISEDIMHENCLNNIVDQIFIVSYESRFEELRATIFQFEKYGIKYQVWDGHSKLKRESIELQELIMKKREYISDKLGGNGEIYVHNMLYKFRTSSRKYSYLTMNWMDIIRYSLNNKYKSILIFEDDILLANREYVDNFCKHIESIPEYYLLRIGDNTRCSEDRKMTYFNEKNSNFGYYTSTHCSFGGFGVIMNQLGMKYLLDIFDYYPYMMINDDAVKLECNSCNNNIYKWFIIGAVDTYQHVCRKHNKQICNKLLDIHPSIVLPYVLSSSLRKKRDQIDWMEQRGYNFDYFTHFWFLRFNNYKRFYRNNTLNVTLFNGNNDDYDAFKITYKNWKQLSLLF